MYGNCLRRYLERSVLLRDVREARSPVFAVLIQDDVSVFDCVLALAGVCLRSRCCRSCCESLRKSLCCDRVIGKLFPVIFLLRACRFESDLARVLSYSKSAERLVDLVVALLCSIPFDAVCVVRRSRLCLRSCRRDFSCLIIHESLDNGLVLGKSLAVIFLARASRSDGKGRLVYCESSVDSVHVSEVPGPVLTLRVPDHILIVNDVQAGPCVCLASARRSFHGESLRKSARCD